MLRRALLALCALVAAFAGQAIAQTSQEDVKATFLYRFASFIGWPPGVFGAAEQPIQLCVAGAEPLGHALQRITRGQSAGGRPFEVVRLGAANELGGCHILYAVGERADDLLRAARGRPILTVTDSISGAQRGMVHFTIVDARVRFYIDDALAQEAGLGIDPRLLNLALSVRRRTS